MLASRESVTEPPQFYIKTFSDGGAAHSERCISAFPHPYPTLRDLQKEIIKYKRSDGLELNGTLYLPPGGWAVGLCRAVCGCDTRVCGPG
jgi:dipeptidyl aminopeptidase/acylaminoacyl peptidase